MYLYKFYICTRISKNFVCFFLYANIQLYFNTAKYLSIYFSQISNFFADLYKREICISNKERTICFSIDYYLSAFNTTKIQQYFEVSNK